MTRALCMSIGLGAALVAAVGCGGKTAINTDAGEGDAIAVMTGTGGTTGGGHGGGGGSVATTGSGGTGTTGSGGTTGTGAGGASGSVGTTGSGGAIGTGTGGVTGTGGTIGTGGTTGTTGAGGQPGVDAGIMMCMAGAVCPTVNARCTAPCGGGMVRLCFCDPNNRVACQNCMPPPPPACGANVATGRPCNANMNPPCGGCVNGQTESCTCMPAGGGGRGAWNCVIPVPVQACQ